MSALRRIESQEEVQSIQDGAIARTALGFSRNIANERADMLLKKAMSEYRQETLTAEKALTYIAQIVGMDDLRLALQSMSERGLVSEERRDRNAQRR